MYLGKELRELTVEPVQWPAPAPETKPDAAPMVPAAAPEEQEAER
jgi:hypothetical protein